MRISDHLTKGQKSQLNKIKSPKKKQKQKKKKKEHLSERDWKELRGETRQILHRKRGGAWG